LKGVEQLFGKNVEVTIKKISNRQKHTRKWASTGKVNLKGKLDKTNIRDLAYE